MEIKLFSSLKVTHFPIDIYKTRQEMKGLRSAEGIANAGIRLNL
jgi:hypothetical protein